MVILATVMTVYTILKISSHKSGFILLISRTDRLWGPTNHLFSGYGGSLPGVVNLPEREADHSTTSTAEFKNARCFSSQ